MNNLSHIRARLAKATKGPWKVGKTIGSWEVQKERNGKKPPYASINDWPITIAGSFPGGALDKTPDMNFIAHSREDIEWLCDRLDEAMEMARFYASPWGYNHGTVNQNTNVAIKVALDKAGQKAAQFLKSMEGE